MYSTQVVLVVVVERKHRQAGDADNGGVITVNILLAVSHREHSP